MDTRRYATHSAWAAAVAVAFVVGRAGQSSVPSESVRPEAAVGERGVASESPSARGGTGRLTALGLGRQRRGLEAATDPQEILQHAEAFAERLMEADDPLAILDSMPVEDRDVVIRELLLAQLSQGSEVAVRLLLDNNLFGLDRQGVRQLFYWSTLKGDLANGSEEELIHRAGASGETIEFTFLEAKRSKSKRNAQNLASVYSSALAAGADIDGVRDVRGMVEKMTTGVYGSDGFESTMFRVPHLSEEEMEDAMRYLEADLAAGQLLYRSEVN